MKLYEIQNNNFAANTHDDIDYWLKHIWRLHPEEYKIRDDLVVDIKKDLNIFESQLTERNELPFQLGQISGNFSIQRKTNSFKGFPRLVNMGMTFEWNNRLSWKDFPTEKIGKRLSIYRRTSSLIGISTNIKYIGELELDFDGVTEGGLGLLNIEFGSQQLFHSDYPFNDIDGAMLIIEKYLNRPEDLFECQAELIENGFEEFAKL